MKSHGDGKCNFNDFASIGEDVVIEEGVLVFHPENIVLGDNIYIGHQSILKGYYKNKMIIGTGTWIGQQCFFNSAGGLFIGNNVGIGPGVKIITSYHLLEDKNNPILHQPIVFERVILEDGCDIGVNSTILPGVKIGKGAQVGAGSVVTKDVEPYSITAGSPAKLLRYR
jgi:acetyltransferase-like isoleucine patch superfamily enzyme